ncbi:hypothetical protein VTN31DRAFT_2030 [Thermomyces dupontii]|uniref:uncharacterized protein n=1 Tax=Talaromyces thermophilus TaxID=28565 RepID=UPI0037438BDC
MAFSVRHVYSSFFLIASNAQVLQTLELSLSNMSSNSEGQRPKKNAKQQNGEQQSIKDATGSNAEKRLHERDESSEREAERERKKRKRNGKHKEKKRKRRGDERDKMKQKRKQKREKQKRKRLEKEKQRELKRERKMWERIVAEKQGALERERELWERIVAQKQGTIEREREAWKHIKEEQRDLARKIEEWVRIAEERQVVIDVERKERKRIEDELQCRIQSNSGTSLINHIEAFNDEFYKRFEVQPDKDRASRGYLTNPQNKLCPIRLQKWSDFPELKQEELDKVFYVCPNDARIFASLQEVRFHAEMSMSDQKISNEADLQGVMRVMIE